MLAHSFITASHNKRYILCRKSDFYKLIKIVVLNCFIIIGWRGQYHRVKIIFHRLLLCIHNTTKSICKTFIFIFFFENIAYSSNFQTFLICATLKISDNLKIRRKFAAECHSFAYIKFLF